MRTGNTQELEEVTWPSSTLARLFSTGMSTMTPASAVNDGAVGAVFRRRRRHIELGTWLQNTAQVPPRRSGLTDRPDFTIDLDFYQDMRA
jgi:hypothetical protein